MFALLYLPHLKTRAPFKITAGNEVFLFMANAACPDHPALSFDDPREFERVEKIIRRFDTGKKACALFGEMDSGKRAESSLERLCAGPHAAMPAPRKAVLLRMQQRVAEELAKLDGVLPRESIVQMPVAQPAPIVQADIYNSPAMPKDSYATQDLAHMPLSELKTLAIGFGVPGNSRRQILESWFAGSAAA